MVCQADEALREYDMYVEQAVVEAVEWARPASPEVNPPTSTPWMLKYVIFDACTTMPKRAFINMKPLFFLDLVTS